MLLLTFIIIMICQLSTILSDLAFDETSKPFSFMLFSGTKNFLFQADRCGRVAVCLFCYFVRSLQVSSHPPSRMRDLMVAAGLRSSEEKQSWLYTIWATLVELGSRGEHDHVTSCSRIGWEQTLLDGTLASASVRVSVARDIEELSCSRWS